MKRVLGIEWNVKSDKFIFSFANVLKLAHSLTPTKRNILKIAASFFDPLGFISPVTARVKTIFQLLCKEKGEWDSPASSETVSVWYAFLSDLEALKEIEVNRFSFVEITAIILTVTIYGFSDSSSQVYCGVCYLQIKTSVGIRVHFIAGKTKVAPLKLITIPRLELLGCVLLSDLVQQIKSAFLERIKIDEILCWTDSEVALC